MSAKRPRRDDPVVKEEVKRAKNKEETVITINYDAKKLIGAIASSDLPAILNELFRIKKYLTTKERVLNFLENDRQCFRAIISFLLNHGEKFLRRTLVDDEEMEMEGQQLSMTILRESFSLLANACHLSVLACVEIRSKDISLSGLYIRFLSASPDIVPIPLKAALLRLLGNLCELKDAATTVALNKSLMEQITSSVELPNQKAVHQALRILRLLAKRSQLSKSVIRAEGCFRIAKYMTSQKSGEEAHPQQQQNIFQGHMEILQTFHNLLKYHPSNTGRQLANCSEFIAQSLAFLLEFPRGEERQEVEKYWMELILRCTERSYEMRTTFGQSAIGKVLEAAPKQRKLPDVHCRFLCSFIQDAWIQLHQNGALDKILDRLEPPELTGTDQHERIAHMRIQSNILDNLRHVIYGDSLGYTIRYPTFMPTALHHIRTYLDLYGIKCQIEYIEPENQIHTFPFATMSLDDEDLQMQEAIIESALANAGPSSLQSIPPGRNPWSPSMSPSTSGQFSPTSPASSPPFTAFDSGCSSPSLTHSPPSFLLDEYLEFDANDASRHETASPAIYRSAPDELEHDDPTEIILNERSFIISSTERAAGADREDINAASEEEFELRQKIVRSCLWLITHFSHQDERQSIFLLREEILHPLVRHISEAPEMDNKLTRALRRLARHQSGLPAMLEMDFYRMVTGQLIRRPCTLARFAKHCVRCDVRREFGRSLLGDHSLIADSPMGEYILLKSRLDSAAQIEDSKEAEFARWQTLIAALVLLRREERKNRFYYNFRPIDALLGALGNIMRQSFYGQPLEEESSEGQICCDMIAAFGSLVSQQHFDNSLEVHQQGFKKFSNSQKPIEQNDGDKCKLQPDNKEEGEKPEATLKFLNTRGDLLAEVPKSELCTWNEYFSGMFGSEFIERLEGRNQFVFDSNAEACTEEEFITFLHFSIGCPLQSECVKVGSAECCAALLYLADKYLCTRLLDHLLTNGFAAGFITGQTLRLFLPLVLSVPSIADGGGLKDICMFVLLRHSNNAELVSTLCHLAQCDSGTGKTIDALMCLLHDFIHLQIGLSIRR